jgi:hypothetical protein
MKYNGNKELIFSCATLLAYLHIDFYYQILDLISATRMQHLDEEYRKLKFQNCCVLKLKSINFKKIMYPYFLNVKDFMK